MLVTESTFDTLREVATIRPTLSTRLSERTITTEMTITLGSITAIHKATTTPSSITLMHRSRAVDSIRMQRININTIHILAELFPDNWDLTDIVFISHGIPRSIAHPKLGCVIVAPTGENMPQGMKFEVPHGAIVCLNELSLWCLVSNIPKDDTTVVSPTGEERFLMRMPADGANLLDMTTSESLHFFHHVADIKHFDQLVSRACEKPIAIHVPLDLEYRVLRKERE